MIAKVSVSICLTVATILFSNTAFAEVKCKGDRYASDEIRSGKGTCAELQSDTFYASQYSIDFIPSSKEMVARVSGENRHGSKRSRCKAFFRAINKDGTTKDLIGYTFTVKQNDTVPVASATCPLTYNPTTPPGLDYIQVYLGCWTDKNDDGDYPTGCE